MGFYLYILCRSNDFESTQRAFHKRFGRIALPMPMRVFYELGTLTVDQELAQLRAQCEYTGTSHDDAIRAKNSH